MGRLGIFDGLGGGLCGGGCGGGCGGWDGGCGRGRGCGCDDDRNPDRGLLDHWPGALTGAREEGSANNSGQGYAARDIREPVVGQADISRGIVSQHQRAAAQRKKDQTDPG